MEHVPMNSIEVLQQVYLTGKILMVENMDLTYECDKKKYLDPTNIFEHDY